MTKLFENSNEPLLEINEINPVILSIDIQTSVIFDTITKTNNFNLQFISIFNSLNDLRNEYQRQVNDLLASNFDIKDILRHKGVELAWKYEQAELLFGGQGTADWTESQRLEIIEFGKARNAEGHHINSVADHLNYQANPDNIIFVKDRLEHLELHNGNFQNPTSGDLIDRNERLIMANKKRIFLNELTGLGLSIGIGFGIGFTIGFLVTLAQNGISSESLRNAAIVGVKTGKESAFISMISYTISRGIGEIVSNTLQGVLNNLGLTITDNIIKLSNIAAVGTLSIVIFSIYRFIKLKMEGYNTKECLFRIGKTAIISVASLIISLSVGSIMGVGFASAVVSLGVSVLITAVIFTYSNIKNKYLKEKLQVFVIEKLMPSF